MHRYCKCRQQATNRVQVACGITYVRPGVDTHATQSPTAFAVSCVERLVPLSQALSAWHKAVAALAAEARGPRTFRGYAVALR